MSENPALAAYNKRKNSHLAISIVLDLLGMATYLVPLVGEIGDFIYAPIYGLSIFIMYRKRMLPAVLGGMVGTIEELLPTADVMPTATLMWVYTYVIRKKDTMKQFAEDHQSETAILGNGSV
ncbi:hypothetical protein [Pontibacter sp. G13]|uniref:hypothetical protein n=1 Tax=Pontibacter sp. G13 TaxID=3074898 RepID=UPI002889F364|nr:hypothetical protein [Pontibacter sp. G13]WNJ18320.1 hypothetical protein RJD25_25995 [Pontibacter sp. G13]